ncbi:MULTISPECIES: acyltransferase [unclassified Microcoleus]|uniref:acyltransferase family protein n=1 Tax=unclassified Microcoleus TaxID=2642155 RepID=UPI002FD26F82
MSATQNLSKTRNPGYMIQLDALRGIAVFAVMLEHFVTSNVSGSILSYLKPILHWGTSAITLFFVLSGFLITGILLRCRDTIKSNNQSIGFTLKRFYIRRFLRIFPIYYLTLAVTAIGFNQVRSVFFWHLTYTTNIMVLIRGEWDDTSSHFWSLAMEEQFYIIWPCVMLFLPKKYLLKAILITIGLGVVSKFICYGFNFNEVQILVFPLASMDSLALGALLAFYKYNHEQFKQNQQILCNLGLWVCLPLLVLFNNIALFNMLVRPTVLGIFYVWLISRASEGFSGLPGKFLELKPLVFLGKISYGVYLYHVFLNPTFAKAYELNLFSQIPLPLEVLLKMIITLAIAIPSWLLFEKPINNLKRHFSYKKSTI